MSLGPQLRAPQHHGGPRKVRVSSQCRGDGMEPAMLTALPQSLLKQARVAGQVRAPLHPQAKDGPGEG